MINRRNLLKTTFLTSAAISALPMTATAEFCKHLKTPKQPEGPFYPVQDQIDKDNDLTWIKSHQYTALGDIVIIEGVLTDQNCKGVPNALVEIWQACESGKYNHPSDPNQAELDPNFQYWGKSTTDQNGFYKFKTIIPGSYPAGDGWIRPPHIHFKVSKLGYVELITQMYFANNILNQGDLILKRLPLSEQKKVIVDFIKTDSFPKGQFNIQIEKI